MSYESAVVGDTPVLGNQVIKLVNLGFQALKEVASEDIEEEQQHAKIDLLWAPPSSILRWWLLQDSGHGRGEELP